MASPFSGSMIQLPLPFRPSPSPSPSILRVVKLDTIYEPNITRHNTKLVGYGLKLNRFVLYSD